VSFIAGLIRDLRVECRDVPPSRVIAITGAARGIGRATADELARRGARVAIGDLHPPGAGDFEVDVTDRDSFAAFLDAVEERHGPLDVLVNNAGIMIVGPLADATPAAASKVIDVNVKGVLHGMQLAIPRLRPGGHIVNVVSSSAWIAPPALAVYSASKHAARGLTDSVRDEVRKAGIAVTGVYPGVVDTDLAVGTRAARGSKMISPHEVARAIAGAVERPRAELFVPRSLGVLLRSYQAMPPRARALFGRAIGIEDLYGTVDPASRASYESSLG
jgi:NAD(P)-dependent dehydrogenase (short-subunit alcohol dehydrogenase family)